MMFRKIPEKKLQTEYEEEEEEPLTWTDDDAFELMNIYFANQVQTAHCQEDLM